MAAYNTHAMGNDTASASPPPVSSAIQDKWRTWVVLLLVLVAVGGGYLVSVCQRAPWFGYLDKFTGGWTLAASTVFAQHWYDEGAFALRFTMYWEGKDKALREQPPRTPYISYPPGAVVPLYLWAWWTKHRPQVEQTAAYNLFVQGVTALLLSTLAFLLGSLLRLPPILNGVLAVWPGLFYCFLPSPYYEHQMGYFADQAVLLPWLSAVALEYALCRVKVRGIRVLLTVLSVGTIFLGVCTEWIFVPLVVCLWAGRLVRSFSEGLRACLKATAAVWVPCIVALGLYALQLYGLDAFDDLLKRFGQRSGTVNASHIAFLMNEPLQWQLPDLWRLVSTSAFRQHFLSNGFGPLGHAAFITAALLLFVLLLLALFSRKSVNRASGLTELTYVYFLLELPPLLHLLLLSEHNSYPLHFFAVLKFAPAVALLSWAIPSVAYALSARSTAQKPMGRGLLVACIFLWIGLCLYYLFYVLEPVRAAAYPPPEQERVLLARFLGGNADARDVCVAPGFSVTARDSRYYVYSGKVVHEIFALQQIPELLERTDDDATLALLCRQPEDSNLFAPLLTYAAAKMQAQGFALYRLNKAAALAVLPAASASTPYSIGLPSPIPAGALQGTGATSAATENNAVRPVSAPGGSSATTSSSPQVKTPTP